MFRTIIVAALVACVAADGIPSFVTAGKCASVANQDNFDLRRYAGRWYQTHIIENAYQPVTRCINSNYEYSGNDYGFKVTTAGFNPNDEYLKIDFKVYPTKEFPAAHMLIDAPSVFAAPYEVIETDYETYSCVYSCITTDNYKSEFAFVFSRTPQTSGPAVEKCAAVFNKNGVEFSKFVPVSHTAECVYRA
ncbi:crustacyanin-A2 subunit [Homarus americanus]|uniref:Crustacyanin-A2 subunit-like 3 n=1 Tax=Homarus americanus TaxID=6706 RepID=A0A8J5NCL4_HOMAM|nr:crustacyanin-A2 subunit [Homarus americanus]KAG7177237.1 Crustacyanin-A2 subunit-like 3 [Homarus americanus]